MTLKRIYYVLFHKLEKSFIPVPPPCAIITFQLKPQKGITSKSAVVEEPARTRTTTETLSCPVTNDTVFNLHVLGLSYLGGFLEALLPLNAKLTAQILLLFIWLLISAIWSFSASICTGSLIIALFTLYIIITAYLELSPQTTRAAEDTENNQADRCC